MTELRWDVIGIGESSVDEVYRVPGALGPNVKLPVSSRHIRFGGQVATTLATVATFGLRTAFMGTIGDDEPALGLRKALEARGVDTSLLIPRPVRHRRAIVLVSEQTGDRAVLWERDERLALASGEIPGAIIESVSLAVTVSRTTGPTITVEMRRSTASWGEGGTDALGMEGAGDPSRGRSISSTCRGARS